jgi:hypothetical protein
MIMNKQTFKHLAAVVALLSASMVNAATVELTPSTQTANNTDTFNLTLHGTEFTNDVNFLNVLLTWDPSLLQLNTSDSLISAAATTAGFDMTSFASSITSTTSSLNLAFDTPIGMPIVTTPSGIFDFLTLEFLVVSPTVTTAIVTAATGGQGGWLDGVNSPLAVTYNNAQVSLNAVPVPAAAWLFGSGLLGLVGVARRTA